MKIRKRKNKLLRFDGAASRDSALPAIATCRKKAIFPESRPINPAPPQALQTSTIKKLSQNVFMVDLAVRLLPEIFKNFNRFFRKKDNAKNEKVNRKNLKGKKLLSPTNDNKIYG